MSINIKDTARSLRCLPQIPFTVLLCLAMSGNSDVQAKDVSLQTNTSQTQVKKKPQIQPYPDTPVWQDTESAAKEYSDFFFVGEYVRDDQALQVTPASGRFYLSIYHGGLPGAGWNNTPVIHRWIEPDKIAAELHGWSKVDRSKTSVGKQAPKNALILFDGKDASAWQNGRMHHGSLKAGCRTKRKFRDFRLYLEFMVPLKPEPPLSHPHRGNSGVFAVGAYEVQIIDTFGLDLSPQAWQEVPILKPANTWCGSIYGIRAPNINMSLPPLLWQSLEIDFKAARFEDGVRASPAVMTVIHNGVKVHDKVKLPRGTGGGPSGPRPEVAEGPVILQNHGNPNLFRNIWIVPH